MLHELPQVCSRMDDGVLIPLPLSGEHGAPPAAGMAHGVAQPSGCRLPPDCAAPAAPLRRPGTALPAAGTAPPPVRRTGSSGRGPPGPAVPQLRRCRRASPTAAVRWTGSAASCGTGWAMARPPHTSSSRPLPGASDRREISPAPPVRCRRHGVAAAGAQIGPGNSVSRTAPVRAFLLR